MNQYTQTPLISEDLFKQHSPVTSSTNISDFIPYICIAQELYIEEIIGEPLMNELKDQIASNTLSSENSNLLVRIAPALSFYAVYQALPFHWASIVNKGVTIRESENSKGVDIKDIAQLRRWIKDDADILRGQLIDFLNRCKADYPLWRPESYCSEILSNNGSTNKKFDSGFFLPSKQKRYK